MVIEGQRTNNTNHLRWSRLNFLRRIGIICLVAAKIFADRQRSIRRANMMETDLNLPPVDILPLDAAAQYEWSKPYDD